MRLLAAVFALCAAAGAQSKSTYGLPCHGSRIELTGTPRVCAGDPCAATLGVMGRTRDLARPVHTTALLLVGGPRVLVLPPCILHVDPWLWILPGYVNRDPKLYWTFRQLGFPVQDGWRAGWTLHVQWLFLQLDGRPLLTNAGKFTLGGLKP